MNKKYTIKFKEIHIFDDSYDCKKLFDKLTDDSWEFIDNGVKHRCINKILKKTNEYYFGKFGELKDFASQNGSAMINDEEHTDGKFKYNVQFLVNYNLKTMIFIYNNNAQCFSNALLNRICEISGLWSLVFDDIKNETFESKIKKCKKIKSIILTRRDPNVFRLINDSFTDTDIENIEIKFKLSKEQSINSNRIIEYRNKHKNDSNYALEYVGEDEDVARTISFVENQFTKCKMVEFSDTELKDTETMFNKLKEILDNYEKE